MDPCQVRNSDQHRSGIAAHVRRLPRLIHDTYALLLRSERASHGGSCHQRLAITLAVLCGTPRGRLLLSPYHKLHAVSPCFLLLRLLVRFPVEESVAAMSIGARGG